jgi:AraC family transcriptional regulator
VYQLIKTIQYIEENIQQDVTLDNLAEHVGLSKFHFARMFCALTGQSPMSYVRKRKITEAAKKIQSEDCRLIDVAFEFQFSSHEAFTRAFKKHFNVPPNDYKNSADLLVSKFQERLNQDFLTHIRQGAVMKPKIMDIEPISVIGTVGNIEAVEHEGSGAKVMDIWKELNEKDEPSSNSKRSLGIWRLLEGDLHTGSFIYMAARDAQSSDTISEGLELYEIPGRTYAVFTHKGDVWDLPKTAQYIWGTWFPKSEYEYAGSPDFECYEHSRFDVKSMKGEVDLYIAVKKL